MAQTEDIADRRQEMLGKLAELDLSAAQAAHASYMEALGTADEAERGLTYQRMSRSLRQTLALHEKFERANVRAVREARDDARRETLLFQPKAPAPARRFIPRDIDAARERADDLRTAVHRLIWSEGFEKSDSATERELPAKMVRWLEMHIDEERCEDHFIDTPLDDQIAEIAEDFELNPDNVPRWRDLPAPDVDLILKLLRDIHGTGPPAARQSSA